MTRRVAAALALAYAGCGGGGGGGTVGDPCVDQPTTAIQLVETNRVAYPGQTIVIRWRIDARDTDGVLIGAAGEATIDGPGTVVEHTGEYLAWTAGMEHGEYTLQVGRAGCADDFILDNVVVTGPDLDPVMSEPAGIQGSDAVAWSPDSSRVAVASRDLLRVYDVDGDYVAARAPACSASPSGWRGRRTARGSRSPTTRAWTAGRCW